MDVQVQTAFPLAGGEMGALVRAHDWAATPVGPTETWPEALRVVLALILDSPESMYLVWGPKLTFFFNDAYRPILGARLPGALGASLPELWPDAWASVRDGVEKCFAGEATRYVDLPITMTRNGPPEDTWWTFSYSPVRDGSGHVVGLLCLTNETTDRVRATAALSASEARNRQILDSAVDYAIIATDLDGRVTRWNEGAYRIIGWSEQEMLGQPVHRFFTPEDNAHGQVDKEMTAALNVGRGTDERWHQRKSGERFWALGEMTPLKGEDDVVTGFVKVLRDRTAQRLAAEALEQSERRYRMLYEAIDAGFCIVEVKCDEKQAPRDYRFLEVNPAFEKQTGLRNATGRWMRDLAPEHEQYWFDTYQRIAETGESVRFEFEAHALGERWYEVHAYRVGRPSDHHVAILFNDISQRKATEAKLIENEALLQEQNATLEQHVEERTRERDQVWDASIDLLSVTNFDGYFLRLNPAWSATLGWSNTEMLVRPLLDLLHPEDLEETQTALMKLAGGVPQIGFENRYRCKDGSYRWLSWNAVPRDGLIFSVTRDVTETREQTEALHRTEEALRQSQKMEAVGQLTGGLAHDFNNLLTGVTGSLELLQTRIAQGRIREIDRYINAAQGAAKRAAALTHRLLAFSRRQTLDPKPTDVNRLVTGMEELIRRTVGPEIELESMIEDAGLWPTLVDPGQLENALLNLCINARDAMPDGGKLTIETANRWLDPRMAQDRDLLPGQYISLCVSDTGTGMTPEVVAKAFDPFFTTKPIGMGTGLGLSMIYGFSKQSGGQVRIHSEVGKGTTVCLYLPRHLGEADGTEQEPELADAPRAEAGQTVLVVDDEPTVRMLVTEVLEDLGYTAIEAADGASGLKVLQSDVRIDLLVTDVGLPGGINGRQVADAARVARPNLKVLFITGYAENAVLSHGHLDPGMHVMTKPFAMEALASRIKELISD